MNPIQQGLYVSLVGIVVLFITASIFYLLLIGLQALFPAKEETEDEAEKEVVAVAKESSDEKAIVAAIAVAINLAQSTKPVPGLGDALLENHSAWWSAKAMPASNQTSSISRK